MISLRGTEHATLLRLSLVLVAWACFAVLYNVIVVSSDTPLLEGDDAVYLLMADYFSPFSQRAPAITELVMRHSQFPPFFPMVLGLAGADSAHLALAFRITVGCLLAAMLLYFHWANRLLENATLALLLMIGFGLAPITIAQSFGILSENLYLLLTLAALVCAAQARGGAWLTAAAVAIGLACATRTVGLALWLAFAGWLLLQRKREGIWLAGLAALPAVLWFAWKWHQGYYGSYVGTFLEFLGQQSALEAVWARWSSVPFELGRGWLASFDHRISPALVGGLLLGALCLAGLVQRVLSRSLDGFYVAIYLLVILFWPYPYELRRLLYPVLPILLAQGLLFALSLARRHAHSRVATVYPYVYVAIFGLTLFSSTMTFAERVHQGLLPENRSYASMAAWYVYPDQKQAAQRLKEQAALAATWREVPRYVPPEECVYHIKPASFMLYADRPAYATPFYRPQTGDYLKQASQCRFFYLGAYLYFPYTEVFYPERHIQHAAQVVAVDSLAVPGGHRLLGKMVLVRGTAPASSAPSTSHR
jgi:hypothetical protein